MGYGDYAGGSVDGARSSWEGEDRERRLFFMTKIGIDLTLETSDAGIRSDDDHCPQDARRGLILPFVHMNCIVPGIKRGYFFSTWIWTVCRFFVFLNSPSTKHA